MVKVRLLHPNNNITVVLVKVQSGFFSGSSNNDNPDDPVNGGFPHFPQPESVEKTQDRVTSMDDQICQMSELTDSESESETGEQCADTNNKRGDFIGKP